MSAEPPIIAGISAVSTSSTCCEETRVARLGVSAITFALKAATAACQPSGSLPAIWYSKVAPCLLAFRSEEHTSELQSLMRISYAVFCLKKKKTYSLTYNHL